MRLSVLPPLRSSITHTLAPSARRASTRWEPIKPAPPVTRTRAPSKELPWRERQLVSDGVFIRPASERPRNIEFGSLDEWLSLSTRLLAGPGLTGPDHLPRRRMSR